VLLLGTGLATTDVWMTYGPALGMLTPVFLLAAVASSAVVEVAAHQRATAVQEEWRRVWHVANADSPLTTRYVSTLSEKFGRFDHGFPPRELVAAWSEASAAGERDADRFVRSWIFREASPRT
jgi:hypothetical protein